MFQVVFEYSLWWLLPISLVALLLSALLYYKSKQWTKAQKLGLGAFRFVSLVLLGVLLLSPLLQTTEFLEEKPLLVWLEDHSQSVSLSADSNLVNEFYVEAKETWQKQLSEKYRVEYLKFGATLDKDSVNSLETNIYKSIKTSTERYYNQNVGGLVLISDGIYNRGSHPSYAAKEINFPIFTVGTGDTSQHSDLWVDAVQTNKVSYLNNQFPVEISIKASELRGKQFEWRLEDEKGKRLFGEELAINNRAFFYKTTVYINADSVGLHGYKLQLSELKEEVQHGNNSKEFSVEVRNNRKKVVLAASRVHPDIGALKRALSKFDEFEVAVLNPSEFNNAGEVFLYILHNPTTEMFSQLQNSKAAIWTLVGENTSQTGLGQSMEVDLKIGVFEEMETYLKNDFSLFTLSPDTDDWLAEMPPLLGSFNDANSAGKTYALLNKKIGKLRTQKPMWLFKEKEGRKMALTLGTGLWTWRMEDYRINKNFNQFDELIFKTVQYLSNTVNEQRFIVNFESEYEQSQRVSGRCELRNASGELINEPEVLVSFYDEEGKVYDFSFSKTEEAYFLNAGRLAKGRYRYLAKTTLGDENLSLQGYFEVNENTLEQQNLVAQHGVLQSLSDQSSGAFFSLAQSQNMLEVLMQNTTAKSLQVSETKTRDLVDKRWFFVLVLVLLSVEWAARKYWGNY